MSTSPRPSKIRLPSPRRVLRSRVFPWVLAALMAALAVTTFLLWRGERGEDERIASVEAVAGRFLIALTNFSAATIERDVSEIRSFAVGRFAEEAEATFSPERVQAIRDNQSTSTGRVRDLFVQQLGEDTATVFGVVDETVVNAASPVPSTNTLRVEVGLIETSDAWKVERVELLQTPETPGA